MRKMDICIGFGLCTERVCDPSPTICTLACSSAPPHFASSPPPSAAAAAAYTFRPFSASGGGKGDNGDGKGGKFEPWSFSADHPDHCFFSSDGSDLSGISDEPAEDAAPKEKSRGDVFGHIDEEFASGGGGGTMTGCVGTPSSTSLGGSMVIGRRWRRCSMWGLLCRGALRTSRAS